jgi:hypothetical protein
MGSEGAGRLGQPGCELNCDPGLTALTLLTGLQPVNGATRATVAL